MTTAKMTKDAARALLPAWAKVAAETLSTIEPDRGNRYAPRSVRTRGAAAHAQWLLTCRALATAMPRDGRARMPDRAAFLTLCGCPDADEE